MTSKYTRDDRSKAAAALLGYNNSIAASRACGIPASTIRHWSNHDEDFQLMYQELQAEFSAEMKRKYAQIINEAADQTIDRLKNGDYIRDTKTGKLIRVPLKGKDAAIIGAISFDKLSLAENQPTAIVRHEDSDKEIQRLVDHFRAISEASQEQNE